MEDTLLDTDEAAEFLASNAAALKRWRYEGIGPEYVRVGPRAVRYWRSALDEFARANTVTPAS